MKIEFASIGTLGTNCYIIKDEKSGEAAAIDCAVFNGDYKRLLERSEVSKLKYILLTHGHFDHICGVEMLRNEMGGSVLIHPFDADCLFDEEKSLNTRVHFAQQKPVKPDGMLNDGDKLFLGESEITVMHTSGHTKGSVCFLTGTALFSGDTLFRTSVGRVDFPGGSQEEMAGSLRRLLRLSFDGTVFPGHGEKTTLEFERRYNPFTAVFGL